MKVCEACGKQINEWQLERERWGREVKYCSKECWGKRVREHGYDHTFLNEMNEFSAYFIGLFVADGHKDKKEGRIHLTSTDKDLIDFIVEKTEYTNEIAERMEDRFNKPQYHISFSGDVTKRFTEMGFPDGRKAEIVFIPKCIIEKWFPHFLRGYLDGDGSFTIEKKYGYLRCSAASNSKKLLDQIHKRLTELGVVTGGGVCDSGNVENKHIIYFSHTDSIAIGHFIYRNATYYLDRKRKVFFEGKNTKLSAIPQKGHTCSVEGCYNECYAKDCCKKHYDEFYRENHREETNEWRRDWYKQYLAKNKERINAKRRANYMEDPERHREYARIWANLNPEKVKEMKKRYRAENKQKIRDYKKDYRNHNIEKDREKDRERYQREKEKRKARQKEYYKKNKEKIKAYQQKYKEENKEKVDAYQKQYAIDHAEERCIKAKQWHEKNKNPPT